MNRAWSNLYFSIVLVCSQLSAAPAWDCAEADWVRPVNYRDGVFESRLGTTCTLKTPGSLKRLGTKLKKKVHDTSTVNSQQRIRYHGLNGWKIDVSHVVKEEDLEIQINEDLYLVMSDKELRYETLSKKLKAEGMASYVRKLGFKAHVEKGPDGIVVKMENMVQVERPWYALKPLFVVLAKDISKDKFKAARDKILPVIQDFL